MRIVQFTVDSSQFTVGNPHQQMISREHAANGERNTENRRSLFANPLSEVRGIAAAEGRQFQAVSDEAWLNGWTGRLARGPDPM